MNYDNWLRDKLKRSILNKEDWLKIFKDNERSKKIIMECLKNE